MDTTKQESHNLADISGISPTRQQYIREGLGIQTLKQLVTASPEDIRDCIKGKDIHQRVSVSQVKRWQKKAKELTAADSSPVDIPEKKGEWTAFATYVVEFQERFNQKGQEFQTQVHHMEGGYDGGGRGDKWQGLAVKKAGQWIETDALELVSDTQKNTPDKVHKRQPVAPKPIPQTAISIQGLEFIQPINEEHPTKLDGTGRMFTQPIHSETPFDLRIIFELVEEGNAHNGSIPYVSAEAYVTNKSTGETKLLSENKRQPILVDQAQQIVNLPKNQLLQGVYRLQVIVRALESPGTLGFLEVPFLWVT
ncbi:MAG: hypothetical protein H6667_20695 [Ardenticatenaceae bacterium]|nr:hypothetical protein [Ardenticatenaceae bacterium]MCB9445693.1 hypothetical protein [Ardenticatenaceae bacterium]